MSKPETGSTIPRWTVSFFRQRHRNKVHDIVVDALKKAGISQAELARRLGRRSDVICRWIGAPGNWTLDTVSDLLLAIDGLEAEYTTGSPFESYGRNFISPEWLSGTTAKESKHYFNYAGGKTVSKTQSTAAKNLHLELTS